MRKPAKLSELTRPSATSSASASSSCGRKRPVPSTSSSKNEAPCARMQSTTACARVLRTNGVRCRRKRGPERRMAPRQQGDGCRPHRRGATLAARGAGVARAEPRPGDAAGETLIVEPGGIVFGKARRQDLGLPGAGRRLEALELPDDGDRARRVRPCASRAPRAASSGGSAGNRGPRRARSRRAAASRCNGGCAPAACARTIPSPLRARREAAAHRKAFGLERGERSGDIGVDRARAAPRASPASPGLSLRAGRAESRPAPRRQRRRCGAPPAQRSAGRAAPRARSRGTAAGARR